MAPAEALYPAARRAKAEAVTRSVRLAGTYDADQTAILDAYRQHDADLDAYARAFAWKEGQAGVIRGIGGPIACADLFDHPETFRRLYPGSSDPTRTTRWAWRKGKWMRRPGSASWRPPPTRR